MHSKEGRVSSWRNGQVSPRNVQRFEAGGVPSPPKSPDSHCPCTGRSPPTRGACRHRTVSPAPPVGPVTLCNLRFLRTYEHTTASLRSALQIHHPTAAYCERLECKSSPKSHFCAPSGAGTAVPAPDFTHNPSKALNDCRNLLNPIIFTCKPRFLLK